jgi:hypothetical protein
VTRHGVHALSAYMTFFGFLTDVSPPRLERCSEMRGVTARHVETNTDYSPLAGSASVGSVVRLETVSSVFCRSMRRVSTSLPRARMRPYGVFDHCDPWRTSST